MSLIQNKPHDDPDLERLRQVVIDRGTELNNAARIYHAALMAAYPLQLGDIIESANGEQARVNALHVQYGEVKALARHRNKNGEFGNREASLWRNEWKNPKVIGHEPVKEQHDT